MPSKGCKASKVTKPSSQSSQSHKRTASGPSLSQTRATSNAPSEASHVSPQKKRRHSRRLSMTSTGAVVQETVETSHHERRKRVRTSEPGPAIVIDESPLPSLQTDRRSTLSPGLINRLRQSGDDIEVQFTPLRAVYGPDARTRRRLARSHISEEMNSIEEHQREDAKQRQEMDSLRSRMAEKDNEIQRLTWEHEQQRQMAIQIDEEQPVHIKAMAEELEALKKEVENLKANNPHVDFDDEAMDEDNFAGADAEDAAAMDDYDGNDVGATALERYVKEDEDEDNMQTLVGSDPPTHESSAHQSKVVKTTKRTTRKTIVHADVDVSMRKKLLLDPMRETELKEFEGSVTTLHQEIAEKNAALDILNIELRALGFTTGSADEVLVTIRSAFRDARSTFDAIFPGDRAIELENGDFLQVLLDRMEAVKTERDIKIQQLTTETQKASIFESSRTELSAKVHELESRKKVLEKQWHDMDLDREEKAKLVLDLELERDELAEDLQERDSALATKNEDIAALQADIEDQEDTIKHHTEAKKQLYKERVQLDNNFALLQQQMENLKGQHDEALRTLQAQFEEEQSRREAAEEDADSKQSQITRLQCDLEETKEQLDQSYDDLASAKERLIILQNTLGTVEGQAEERKSTNEELESEVEAAYEKMRGLETDLENIRAELAQEQSQYEIAARNNEQQTEINQELQDKVSKLGKESNELKSKLFERQTQIEALGKEATDREEQYQRDMAEEIQRREDVEAVSRTHEATIDELEQEIDTITAAKEALQSEKDALIKSQGARIDELEVEVEKSQNNHADLESQTSNHIADLESKINDLEDTISDHVATISRLQAAATSAERAHQLELEQKHDEVNKYAFDLNGSREEAASLQQDRDDLSARLKDAEDEISDLRDDHAAEISRLQSEIASLDDKITSLANAGVEKEQAYEEVIVEEKTKYSNLGAHASKLQSDNDNLKRKLQLAKEAYMELEADSTATLKEQERELANTVSIFERSKEIFLEKTSSKSALVHEIFSIDDDDSQLATPSSTQNGSLKRQSDEELESTSTKKTKKTKKKSGFFSRRWRDSGFGVEEAEETLEDGECEPIAA